MNRKRMIKSELIVVVIPRREGGRGKYDGVDGGIWSM